MRRSSIRGILLITALGSLTACGGGGGGSGGVRSIAPPPAPPPPTYTAVNIFPAITTSTQFATLGLEAGANVTQLADLTKSGFAVSYDAASKLYVFDFPSTEAGGFYSVQSNESNWNGQLANPLSAGTFQPGGVTVQKPAAEQLTYTSFALYGNPVAPLGVAAFGSATPASGVPVAGSATFNALGRGSTLDGYYVDGTATLNFDFGAGTLGGHFDIDVSDGWEGFTSLGRYDFVNTVYGAGSAAFSGSLARSGGGGAGAFDGLFTGPNGQELMARWTATYEGTIGSLQMFGVLVGKKCC